MNGKVAVWGCWADEVSSFTISEDGSIAALSIDGTLKCVNARTGDEYWSYTDPNRGDIRSEISANGEYIISCTNKGAMLFSTWTGDELWNMTFLPGPRGSLSCSICDNGSLFLIMLNGDGYLWDLEGELVTHYDLGDSDYAVGKISGDGQNIVAVDNNNEHKKNSTINYFSTISDLPLWTTEIIGNGFNCEISRNGDEVFLTQHDMGTFIEQDPWGISHTLPSDYQVGTADFFGGATLFNADGELLWTVEMEGIQSYDLDRDGDWFTFSGGNRKVVLMDRTAIIRDLEFPYGKLVYNSRVTSNGTWLFSQGRKMIAYDALGNLILDRPFAGSDTYKSIQYIQISEDGVLFYFCTNGAFLAYDFGPYPEVTILIPEEIYVGEPAEINVSVNDNGLTLKTVEWYLDGTDAPPKITEIEEGVTVSYGEVTCGSIIAVVNTEEGYSGVTRADLWVQENVTKSEEESSGDPGTIILISLVISIFILTLVLKRKVRKR